MFSSDPSLAFAFKSLWFHLDDAFWEGISMCLVTDDSFPNDISSLLDIAILEYTDNSKHPPGPALWVLPTSEPKPMPRNLAL